MTRLFVSALYYLVFTEWLMYRRGIEALHNALKRLPTTTTAAPLWTAEQLCRAMDIACVLYFKHILCLQRSAATTMLLRNHGFAAELVIGARIVPFRSHAWVELNGSVINDSSYTPELYRELERC